MRLVYLSLTSGNAGIEKKLVQKVKALNAVGIATTGLFLKNDYTESDEDYFLSHNIHLFKCEYKSFPLILSWPFFWRFHVFYENWVLYKKIKKELKKLDHFDYIFFRYPIWNLDLNLWWFMLKYRKKILFEHNSIETDEIKHYYDLTEGNFRYKYMLWADKWLAPSILRMALCLVGVTHEINQYEIKRARKKIPYFTLSNGFEVSSVAVRKTPIFDGQFLQILFLAGFEGKWHGIDRILLGMANYRGAIPIKLKIVGKVVDEVKSQIKELNLESCVSTEDVLSGEALNKVFNECHIAAGSLALYRTGHQEACVLKVREYLSRGIPFFLAYNDTDLMDSSKTQKISPFFLQIPNDSSPVDMEKIIQFAKNALSDEKHPEKIRAFAQSHLDYQVKMSQLKQFLESL